MCLEKIHSSIKGSLLDESCVHCAEYILFKYLNIFEAKKGSKEITVDQNRHLKEKKWAENEWSLVVIFSIPLKTEREKHNSSSCQKVKLKLAALISFWRKCMPATRWASIFSGLTLKISKSSTDQREKNLCSCHLKWQETSCFSARRPWRIFRNLTCQ